MKDKTPTEGRVMKAIVCTRYGPPDALEFKDVATPAPADDQVLIKICAASANPLDWRILRGDPWLVRLFMGLFKPKVEIRGSDFAGRVEAVGKNVKQLQAGDEVFGAKGFAGGAFAEYVCAREEELAPKVAGMSFEQAAAMPVAALTALQGLRDKGQIKAGQKVLVDGASGGVGTFAVQIAKSFGAEVTAVCSTAKMETARAIGADHAIDYTRQDFTRSGQRYDLILAANAYHSIVDYRRAMSEDGICVKTGGSAKLSGMLQDMLVAPILALSGRKKTCSLFAKMNRSDFLFLNDLFEAGKMTPVIDRSFPLSETAAALRYLEEGHAQGKVVITFPS